MSVVSPFCALEIKNSGLEYARKYCRKCLVILVGLVSTNSALSGIDMLDISLDILFSMILIAYGFNRMISRLSKLFDWKFPLMTPYSSVDKLTHDTHSLRTVSKQ